MVERSTPEELGLLADFWGVAGAVPSAAAEEPAAKKAVATPVATAPPPAAKAKVTAKAMAKAKASPAGAPAAAASAPPVAKAKAAAPAGAPAAAASAPPSGLPATKRLYLTYEGNFQLQCVGTVLWSSAVTTAADGAATADLVFDTSTFHPQGGGQPSDVGVIRNGSNGLEVRVAKAVFDMATGIVTHRCAFDDAASAVEAFRAGDRCELLVDAATREKVSACHTAGHAVDSAMARAGYLLPPTKGYHFLDGPYVEYRGDVPAGDRDSLVAQLQREFAGLVEEDIATTIEEMPKARAEAELNKVQENFDFSVFKDPTVRVVGVAGFKCPCGGTHVRSTRLLRGYDVVGIRVKKGIVRVKYDARRAA